MLQLTRVNPLALETALIQYLVVESAGAPTRPSNRAHRLLFGRAGEESVFLEFSAGRLWADGGQVFPCCVQEAASRVRFFRLERNRNIATR